MKKTKLLTLLGVAMAALTFIAPARAAVNLTDWHTMTNANSLTITNGQTLTLSGSVIDLRKDTGIAILPTFFGTNDTTANVTFSFLLSADGTNWTTVSQDYTRALNGTNIVRGYKYWPQTELGGVRYFRLGSIASAHTNSITISNVVYSRFN